MARVWLADATSSARSQVRVHDADKLDARHRRQNARVVLAEMADADDGDAKRAQCVRLRPTMAIFASLADARTAS